MEPGTMACPVCTLYLREGMSMQSHLDTHPKDQVIEALVRLYAGPGPGAPGSGPSAPSPLFQMVSEEQSQLLFSRQQVTNILQPALMSFPLYQQQHFGLPQPEFDDHDDPDHCHNVPVISINQEGGLEGEVQDLTTMLTGEEPVKEAVGEYEGDEDGEGGSPLQSPGHSPGSVGAASPISVRMDLRHERPEFSDQYITSDCDYGEEKVGEGEEEPEPGQEDEEEPPDHEPEPEPGDDEHKAGEEEEAGGQGANSLDDMSSSLWLGQEESHHFAGPMLSQLPPLPHLPNCWPPSTQQDNNRTFSCLYCSQEFPCPKERRLHIATLHANSGQEPAKPAKKEAASEGGGGHLSCTECGLAALSHKELKDHIKTAHRKQPATTSTTVSRQCSVCAQVFPTRAAYVEHIVKVHPLECGVCGKTFHTKSSLTLHAKSHLEVKPHPCSMCPKSFTTAQKLREHINSHTGFAPIQCNMCDRKFRRYSNLKQHKDVSHLNIKKKCREWFCDCGESFPTKKKLAWHKEVHSEKPKQCMYCSERYVHTASLTRHIRRSHDPQYLPDQTKDKVKNVQCPVCNMVFVEGSLRGHLKLHGLSKPFGCVICGKKFLTKWNLQLHRWTHASRASKPFKCNQCKGAFVRLSDFQAHLRSHLGHKPFTCNQCGMQFNRKQNWLRHEREHTSSKGFTCNVCGKSFHRSYYLLEHQRIHAGVKPFTCHICNKTSTTKSNHNKHLRTHHAREPLNTEG